MNSETEMFDLWMVACDTLEPGKLRRCIARLPIVKSDTKQFIAVLNAERDEGGMPQLVVQIPTSILVQRGGKFGLPGGDTRMFAISSCQPASCSGVLQLDPALVQALSKANEATIAWTAISGAPLEVKFDVKGAAGALQAMSK